MDVQFIGIGPSHASTAEVKYVLWVPYLKANLLSVPVLTRNGYQVNFGRENCAVMRNSHIKFHGYEKGGVFIVNGRMRTLQQGTANVALKNGESL